jgi:hypothetical protein
MNRRKLIPTTIMIFILITGLNCDSDYGQRLEFNGGELFYTSKITSEEAKRLGQYLVSEGFYDGNEKTVQIDKTGTTYEFKMPIKKGLEHDQQFRQILKIFAKELSNNVFRGSQVDVHLCDEYLKTIQVIVAL